MDEHLVIVAQCVEKKFKRPHAEAQAADANFMIRIAGVGFKSILSPLHNE